MRRLDLSWNEIRELPGEGLRRLTALEELTLTGNPLTTLPPELCECRSLRVLDVRNTCITVLPMELARLPQLRELLQSGASAKAGSSALIADLAHKDERAGLCTALRRVLREEVYAEVAETERGADLLEDVIADVMRVFEDSVQLKTLVRNASRLFPPSIDKANASEILGSLRALNDDLERRKLSAELELKLRAVYFDRIRPEVVPGLVHDILAQIRTLRDMRFLLHHAKDILPPDPAGVSGAGVHPPLHDLRARLEAATSAAVAVLAHALRSKYPEREPSDLHSVATECARLLRNPTLVRTLASDAQSLFPADFQDISPPSVVKAFRVLQARMAE